MARQAVGGRKWVKFEFHAEPGAHVFIAGTFNDWNPGQMRLKDKNKNGSFSTSLLLKNGRHEYKYVVNGNWCADPNCREWAPNAHGSLNSVVVVE